MRIDTLRFPLLVSTVVLVCAGCPGGSDVGEDCFIDEDCSCPEGETGDCEGADVTTATSGSCRCIPDGMGGNGGMGGSTGAGGAAGSSGCAFTSTELDVGWSGSPGPSCSASTISAGALITCSVGVTGAEDVTMKLVDPVGVNTAGSGFVGLPEDGLAEVEFDTVAAPPGEYFLFIDMAPDSDALATYVALEPNDGGNYTWFNVTDNVFSEPGNDLTCPAVTVTIEEP
jgi:hypothetical protein